MYAKFCFSIGGFASNIFSSLAALLTKLVYGMDVICMLNSAFL